MRSLFGVCAIAALATALCGCGSFKKTTTPPRTAQPSAPAPNTPTQPSLIVAPTAVGKVASVNVQAKFAVLIFPVGQVPPPNTRMVVYHGDAKAGEVKVTGPAQDNLTVGDIVLGTVLENDEVRAE
jgi:hypothetical protein